MWTHHKCRFETGQCLGSLISFDYRSHVLLAVVVAVSAMIVVAVVYIGLSSSSYMVRHSSLLLIRLVDV